MDPLRRDKEKAAKEAEAAAAANALKPLEPPDYVKLVSAEGHEFYIERRAAMVSNTLKNMLMTPGNFVDNARGVIELKEISTPILEKVCQYFMYKLKYMHTPYPFPEFKVESDIALELMMAANFLDT
mmetsp:Transcript_6500/g.11221  ORF Transcript_6500/g.11221 Transcript_6500/m.11221 type:complete len:127 (+) Transcript_6500:26-406(+)|eukprot:CAMPEP_0196656864 /NCGR_PEP_ID=MMETSP1086-20130531/19984_1 /TAXON_ID=77921 /ORGANISM="Cyanoptyche  gloeocystis , Strain SAG4.97" /LENGTH=126 /DNA_ID=CAMNT_0041989767 /DNA_START=12 /DNA_END=392 /DNA_ORIENTATION=+